MADIVSDCGIASDGVNPPTLRSEGCQDVFRLQSPVLTLHLSRRHAEVISVEGIARSASGRDPLARSIRTDIPDVESRQVDYQVGGLSRLTADGLPDESARRLRRFMTQSMVY